MPQRTQESDDRGPNPIQVADGTEKFTTLEEMPRDAARKGGVLDIGCEVSFPKKQKVIDLVTPGRVKGAPLVVPEEGMEGPQEGLEEANPEVVDLVTPAAVKGTGQTIVPTMAFVQEQMQTQSISETNEIGHPTFCTQYQHVPDSGSNPAGQTVDSHDEEETSGGGETGASEESREDDTSGRSGGTESETSEEAEDEEDSEMGEEEGPLEIQARTEVTAKEVDNVEEMQLDVPEGETQAVVATRKSSQLRMASTRIDERYVCGKKAKSGEGVVEPNPLQSAEIWEAQVQSAIQSVKRSVAPLRLFFICIENKTKTH